MVTVILPIRVNGTTPRRELVLNTVRKAVYMKRTRRFRLYADKRTGKDSWSIFNEVKKLTGEDFERHVFCSPYDGYAYLCCRL